MMPKIILGILIAAAAGLGIYFFSNRSTRVENTPVPIVTVAPSATPEATLVGPVWKWKETLMNDGAITTASDSSKYTVQFSKTNTYSMLADCNTVNGAYTASGSAISIKPGASTRMFCGETSQDQVFLKDIFLVNSYMLKDNQLVMMLPYDSGSMIFVQ